MDAAIVVQDVGKQFRRFRSDRPLTLQEAVVRGLRGVRAVDRFWALRNVSFTAACGSTVGLIGANGAGKSTLLRLIGGLGRPDEGRVMVRGRLGALLDLGAGFHPDLTGRDSIFVNGIISGLTRREVAERFDAILDFAELADFVDSPLRTYSSGMQLRLAFAIAAHTDPEVLLIDEVLAVGDLHFQNKCLDRIAQFKASGCTILLVSHDMDFVAQLCDVAIWLRAGRLVASGPPATIIPLHVAEMEERPLHH